MRAYGGFHGERDKVPGSSGEPDMTCVPARNVVVAGAAARTYRRNAVFRRPGQRSAGCARNRSGQLRPCARGLVPEPACRFSGDAATLTPVTAPMFGLPSGNSRSDEFFDHTPPDGPWLSAPYRGGNSSKTKGSLTAAGNAASRPLQYSDSEISRTKR